MAPYFRKLRTSLGLFGLRRGPENQGFVYCPSRERPARAQDPDKKPKIENFPNGSPEVPCMGLNDCVVLSREWGNGLFWTIIGDYMGTTLGIHSPIPYLRARQSCGPFRET